RCASQLPSSFQGGAVEKGHGLQQLSGLNSSVGPDRDFHDDGALDASGHSRTWKTGTDVFELFRRLHIPADLEWRVVRCSWLRHGPARDTAWNSADRATLDA